MKRRETPLALLACALVGAAAFLGAPATVGAQDGGIVDMMPPELSPGPHHRHLDHFIGQWDAALTMWVQPDAPPTESKGSMSAEWILDGRFVRENFRGDFMGATFDGVGIYGYDGVEKRYTSVWMDSMSTAMMLSHGSCDESGTTFEYKGQARDPWGGEMTTYRMVIKVENKDKHTFTMYTSTPSTPEFKNMVIVYTRRK